MSVRPFFPEEIHGCIAKDKTCGQELCLDRCSAWQGLWPVPCRRLGHCLSGSKVNGFYYPKLSTLCK